MLFPFIAILWWVRLFRRRRDPDVLTAAMAGLSLLCAFPLAVTTLFVYTQYTRMNAPSNALMFVVVWSTLLWLGTSLAPTASLRRRLASEARERPSAEPLPVAVPTPSPHTRKEP